MAEHWADLLDGAPLAFVHKTRDINVPNHAKPVSKTVVGDIEGRTCVLIDDMIDTGGDHCWRREGPHGQGREGSYHRGNPPGSV